MQLHYERLGINTDATPAQIKAAYHAKLREFPAHTHPQEFKAVRAAYDALRKGGQHSVADFFEPQPIEAELDQNQLQQLRQRALDTVKVDVAQLIRLTF